jgi:hypothetical protein
MTQMQPYAVIFKAFVMDAFVARQLARVYEAAPAGHVYVMMDETAGSAGELLFDRVIRYQEPDLIALGFAAHAQGALFWYNADYPLYYFQTLHPDYDFIVMIEYDAVPQISLDQMVQECRDGGVDFVGQPVPTPVDSYWWSNSMLHFYEYGEIAPYLLCAAVFSGHAVRHLGACRLRQGRDNTVIDEKRWPVGEAFAGTELQRARFCIRELGCFGRLTRYDWWPPVHEAELPDFLGEAMIHPVLVGRRYVVSLFKNGRVTGVVAIIRLNLAWVFLRVLARRFWRGIFLAMRPGRKLGAGPEDPAF